MDNDMVPNEDKCQFLQMESCTALKCETVKINMQSKVVEEIEKAKFLCTMISVYYDYCVL